MQRGLGVPQRQTVAVVDGGGALAEPVHAGEDRVVAVPGAERQDPRRLTVDQAAGIDMTSQVEQVPRTMQDTRLLEEVERRNAVTPGGGLDPPGLDTNLDEIGRPVGELGTAAGGDALAYGEAATVVAVVGAALNRGMVVGFDPGVAPGPAAPIPPPRAAEIVERDFESQHIRLLFRTAGGPRPPAAGRSGHDLV